MPVAAVRSSAVRSLSSSHPTLRFGARGAAVSQLQQALSRAGFNPGPVDGVFGPKTQAAVLNFQRARHLTVDGIVGPQTWGALGGAGTVNPPSTGGTHATGYVNGRPVNLTLASVGGGKYLRTDAAAAYNRMMSAARSAGINLSTVSGFRTMDQQRYLYQQYLSGHGNLAARPGYSNHQGGISADIGGIGGYGTRAYNWLRNNAGRFGFSNDVRGESWHWTFHG